MPATPKTGQGGHMWGSTVGHTNMGVHVGGDHARIALWMQAQMHAVTHPHVHFQPAMTKRLAITDLRGQVDFTLISLQKAYHRWGALEINGSELSVVIGRKASFLLGSNWTFCFSFKSSLGTPTILRQNETGEKKWMSLKQTFVLQPGSPHILESNG